jgi:hypothetical protein
MDPTTCPLSKWKIGVAEIDDYAEAIGKNGLLDVEVWAQKPVVGHFLVTTRRTSGQVFL